MVKEPNKYRVKEKKDDTRMELTDAGNGNKSITQEPGDTTSTDAQDLLINKKEVIELEGSAAHRNSLINRTIENCESIDKATTPLSEKNTANVD